MGDLISSLAAFLTFGAVCGYLGWTIRDHRARCQDALRLSRQLHDERVTRMDGTDG
jgi:hypothetical protein